MVTALVAVISGAAVIGHAAGAPAQSRVRRSSAAARALEPGFAGTFLYRNDNFRTGQDLAESILMPATVNSKNSG